MKANPIVWFELYVKDMARAKRFYESVFETKLEKLDTPVPGVEMWKFLSAENAAGAAGALVKMKDMESTGNGAIVYFRCNDCAQEARSAAKFGGKVHREKTSIGQHGNIALVYDTEGNMIGLHSM